MFKSLHLKRIFGGVVWNMSMVKCFLQKETVLDEKDISELPALGRIAEIGELYDARRDRFLNQNIFREEKPFYWKSKIQNNHAKIDLSIIRSIDEKFKSIDISGELKLSVLAGLFKLEGSGKFFQDYKYSERTAKVLLISSILTIYEKINLKSSEVQSLVDVSALEEIDCTHVVVGIQWGGNVFITVEDRNCEEKDVLIAEKTLETTIKKLMAEMSDFFSIFNYKQDQTKKENLNEYHFEIFGDIVPESVPMNLSDALIFINNTPKLLQTANNGYGKPKTYTLMPINQALKIFKLDKIIETKYYRVNDMDVMKWINFFDEFNKYQQKINDLSEDMKKHKNYLDDKVIEEIENKSFDISIAKSKLEENFSERLVKFRSGEINLKEFQLNETIPRTLYEIIGFQLEFPEKYQDYCDELLFIKQMLKSNVRILCKDESLVDLLTKNIQKTIILLEYNYDHSNNPMALHKFKLLLESPEFKSNSVFILANDKINKNASFATLIEKKVKDKNKSQVIIIKPKKNWNIKKLLNYEYEKVET